MIEDYKNQIQLFEISTDKILLGNPYIVKNPKNIRIMDYYNSIFEEKSINEKETNIEQNLEFQIQILRGMKGRGG